MLAKGLNVPVCLEHRSDAKPKALSADDLKSWKARGTVGHVENYELDSANRVWVNVELPDDADAKQAHKLRFCSPEIDNFTDGDGQDWGEVITHVALTPRPRQYDQPPIARLSLTGPIRLAFDPKTGEDMADEKEDKDEGGKEEEAPPEKKESPQVNAKIKGVIEALKSIGMNIPDEVTDADGLIIAIKAANGPDDGAGAEDELPENIGPTTQNPPIGLSHDATAAEKKSIARADKMERAALKNRIDTLLKSGRIGPPIAQKLNGQLGQIQLSFSADGELASNAVLIQIEAYEALPRQSTWSKKGKRLSHNGDAKPVSHDVRGEEKNDAEVLAAWDKT